MRPIAIALAILAFSAIVAADLPAYRDAYVNDFAGVLDVAQAADLRALFSDIRSSTTAQVVFVSVESTAPDTPAAYRTRLFNAWGVGDKEKDNGLLILYAREQRRIEVEVGYGLEGILPDSKVGRLLDENYVPLRDANRTAEGIVQFSKAAAQVIQDNAEDVRAGNTAGEEMDWFLVAYILLFVLFFILAVRRGGGGYVGSPGFGGSWRSGGGGSFGGGGFGGGGSGGGGAGR